MSFSPKQMAMKKAESVVVGMTIKKITERRSICFIKVVFVCYWVEPIQVGVYASSAFPDVKFHSLFRNPRTLNNTIFAAPSHLLK